MDAQIRSRSLILSVLIHAAILLLLFFFILKTPIPPFPEVGGGGGVLVNIGYVEEASGDVQPMSEKTTTHPQPVKVQPQPKTQEEKIATQSTEEAVAVNTTTKEKNKKTVKAVETVTQLVKEAPKVPEKVVDNRALYKGANTSSKSQGTAAKGAGDQGDPNGDPFSKYTGKNGNGNGPGNGPGEGPGSGPGKGGTKYDLKDRMLRIPPVINEKSQETGIVVVNITVDKAGNVISATPGGRGSTTHNPSLFSAAREAAMTAKFSASPDGSEVQYGSMTFVFLVH